MRNEISNSAKLSLENCAGVALFLNRYFLLAEKEAKDKAMRVLSGSSGEREARRGQGPQGNGGAKEDVTKIVEDAM